MRMRGAKLAGAVLAAFGILAAPQARATLTLTLDNGNLALSGNPGPYGTVGVTRFDNNDATVVLTAASGFRFGDGGTLGLNLNGVGTFTLVNASGDGGAYSQGNPGNEDGFGSFDFTLDTHDGLQDSSTTITLSIHTTDGAWTSDAAVLTPNASGYGVAGHVFVTSNPTILTGFATTPEPTTMIAGALLLLPFGASTLRILRRNRMA